MCVGCYANKYVIGAGDNFRINIDTGDCIVDGNLFYVSDSTTPNAIGVTYTNSVKPAPNSTAEYIIDANVCSIVTAVIAICVVSVLSSLL